MIHPTTGLLSFYEEQRKMKVDNDQLYEKKQGGQRTEWLKRRILMA